MTDYLRFLFSVADRDRIDSTTIIVTETSFDPTPASAAARWPESIRLQFRVRDPANGAPELRMIFPGEVAFTPDAPTGTQVLPAVGSINFTGTMVDQSSFDTWPAKGSLRIHASERAVLDDLKKFNKIGAIGYPPTVAWFAPVAITRPFINDALLNGLERKGIPDPATNATIANTDPSWLEHAVTGFYARTYFPVLKPHRPPSGTAVDRNLDDVIRFPMPRVVMDAAGDVDLTITLVALRSVAERDQFPGANPFAVDRFHPGHPDYEIIPARLFLQDQRSELIGATAGNVVADAAIGTNTFVRDRKAELATLGFGDLGPADNSYGLRARWAVREFQIYAKMPQIATEPVGSAGEYAQRLNPVANPLVYDGPINGFINAMTRERIALWLRPANRFRCPVVITARTGTNYQAVAPNGDNLWLHNQVPDTSPRMHVRDLSGYYALPPQDTRDATVGGNRHIVLGYYQSRALGGPNMEANLHSWASMALDSVPMTGIAEATMAAQPAHATLWSTYLTMLPTIGAEAALRFDLVNAWDSDATISIPFFHYNLHAGELDALLAYLKASAPATFERAIGFFGITPDVEWPNTVNFQGKRTANLQIVQAPGARFTNLSKTQGEENYFKTWHWFYRFVMANRVFGDWKKAAFDFARWRLADILSKPMTRRPAGNTAIVPHDGAAQAVPLSRVFTSELATGMLLRWHVRFPEHIITDVANADGGTLEVAGPRLWNALAKAQTPVTNGGIDVNWSAAVATWSSEHEAAMIAGMLSEAEEVSDNLHTGLTDAGTLSRQGHTLSRERGSFEFASPLTDLSEDPVIQVV